ncbi:MAG: hypothetical protein ACRD5Z_00100, partial [Bryobacteraceae bacterium]
MKSLIAKTKLRRALGEKHDGCDLLVHLDAPKIDQLTFADSSHLDGYRIMPAPSGLCASSLR